MAGENREFAVVNGGATTTTPTQPPAPPPQAPQGGDEVSLAYYLNVIWEGRWLILGALLLAGAAHFAYIATATPQNSAGAINHEDRAASACFTAFSTRFCWGRPVPTYRLTAVLGANSSARRTWCRKSSHRIASSCRTTCQSAEWSYIRHALSPLRVSPSEPSSIEI